MCQLDPNTPKSTHISREEDLKDRSPRLVNVLIARQGDLTAVDDPRDAQTIKGSTFLPGNDPIRDGTKLLE